MLLNAFGDLIYSKMFSVTRHLLPTSLPCPPHIWNDLSSWWGEIPDGTSVALGCCCENLDCIPSSGLLHFGSNLRGVGGLGQLFAPGSLAVRLDVCGCCKNLFLKLKILPLHGIYNLKLHLLIHTWKHGIEGRYFESPHHDLSCLPRWMMKNCCSSWCSKKKQQGLSILGILAVHLPWYTRPGLSLTPALSKRKRKTCSQHPSQPLGILQSQTRKRWTAEKYPCWFWNVFCDVESWSIKSHHVCLNFINSGLSFFGWIFLSFKPQNAVLRNTSLGSVEEHCAKLNRWFWQGYLGSESSFPARRPLL